MAIASLILAIFALIFCWCWPVCFICGIPAIILGALGKKKSGAGTAGMIIGIIAVAIGIICFAACGGAGCLALLG